MNLFTYKYLRQKMMVALGGHACEQMYYGTEGVSSGATSDFNQVTNIAYSLIRDLGYSSNIGKLSINDDLVSEDTRKIIDEEVRNIVSNCYAEVLKVLTENNFIVMQIVEVLMEHETLNTNEFVRLMMKYDLKTCYV